MTDYANGPPLPTNYEPHPNDILSKFEWKDVTPPSNKGLCACARDNWLWISIGLCATFLIATISNYELGWIPEKYFVSFPFDFCFALLWVVPIVMIICGPIQLNAYCKLEGLFYKDKVVLFSALTLITLGILWLYLDISKPEFFESLWESKDRMLERLETK